MSDDNIMARTRAPELAHSTPFDAPLVPDFPFEFRDVWIFTALYRTDLEAVSALLPAPLVAASDVVAIHVYQMNDTDWFGAYNESAVQVDVLYPPTRERGAYSPYLFLDNDGAISAGRETYGQPKKYGRPSIDVRQDLVVAEVSRNGIPVITATMPYKQRRADIKEALEELDFITNINLKVIPSADGAWDVRQLTARTLDHVTIHGCWRAPATVELRPNAQAPVHRLPVREMLDGFYWHCDFTLSHARVMHDYLVPAPVIEGQGVR